MTRRLTLPLVLFIMLFAALPAQAGEAWCMSDPIVRLNGTRVQILVAIPQAYQPLVDGAIEVDVKTPEPVSRELLFTDPGFNGYGERVTFSDLGMSAAGSLSFPARIKVRVPIDKSRLPIGVQVPVQVTVLPDNAGPTVVVGTSDDTVVWTVITGTR